MKHPTEQLREYFGITKDFDAFPFYQHAHGTFYMKNAIQLREDKRKNNSDQYGGMRHCPECGHVFLFCSPNGIPKTTTDIYPEFKEFSNMYPQQICLLCI